LGAPRIPSASNENIPIYPYSVTQRRIVSVSMVSALQHDSKGFNGHDELARFMANCRVQKRSNRPVHFSGQPLDPASAPSLPHLLKVDISALHVRADQLHPEPLADVHAFKAAHQFSFDGRMQQTNPSAFVRSAGNNAIETLADP